MLRVTPDGDTEVWFMHKGPDSGLKIVFSLDDFVAGYNIKLKALRPGWEAKGRIEPLTPRERGELEVKGWKDKVVSKPKTKAGSAGPAENPAAETQG